MLKRFFVIFTVVWGLAGAAAAQQGLWVQVEAKRSLTEAQDTIRQYARAFPFVNGYVLRTGWYAIALGPFAPEDAVTRLADLRRTGQIPGDSFIADGSNFRQQFWPVGAAAQVVQPALPTVNTAPEPVAQPLLSADETPAEARRSEQLLGREQRMDLQTALAWEGFYNGGIDGAFGPGTRNSMALWQSAQGFEATGILTSKQRAKLMGDYQAIIASIGLTPTYDAKAGIEIDLPLALVTLDRYDPPFVHYKAKGDSGVSVLLISQTGDQATLAGLYDIMQTLEIVPLDGPRQLGRNNFALQGSNATISSYTYAELDDGQVKGFTLIWPAGDDRRQALVRDAMRASFRPNPDAVLPDVAGDPGTQSVDLLAGLAIRQPDRARSGFFVDGAGTVLTTSEAVVGCGRVTLGDDIEANVVASDAGGLALLRPSDTLVPVGFARFAPHDPRLNSDVAVSGYSYEGLLGAPTLTYGTLADVVGLDGNPGLDRLELSATDSDAGGPVFDGVGAVFGMLLPTPAADGKILPEGVSFAADTSTIVAFLTDHGVTVAASDASAPMAPEDLTGAAADMTVLVSCWN